MSNYAGVDYNDTTAAPGISLSIYLSGCDFHCNGCHNPEAWDFNYGKELTDEAIANILSHLMDNGIERKVSILGGESLHPKNRAATLKIIEEARKINKNVEIYVWTGFLFEDLLEEEDTMLLKILQLIDVLIDGQYIKSKRDITLPMRGSTNQRILYIKESRNGY